jgi:hypothetical protein
MSEAIALLAAVISAMAAAVGTFVSVAQWRQTSDRRVPEGAGPVVESKTAPAPPSRPGRASLEIDSRQRPRSAVVAVILATVCCVFTAVSQFAYWSQQKAVNGSSWEPLVNATLAVSVLASIVGAAFALPNIGVGLFGGRHLKRLGLGVLALVGCSVPWGGLWIVSIINNS